MKRRILSMLLVFALMFSMMPILVTADTTDLKNFRVTYYDFFVPHDETIAHNPDFQSNDMGTDRGKIADILATKKPLLKDAAHTTIHSDESFAQWYTPVTNINEIIEGKSLTFSQNGSFYEYINTAFFPLEDRKDLPGNLGWTNSGTAHNYHFTMELHTSFTYDPSKTDFTFTGDDDLYVYIDNKLVLDLGGVHPPETLSIVPSWFTANLIKGKTYDFDLYFAERHTVLSNIMIKTNLPLKATKYSLETEVRDMDGKLITVNAPTISASPLPDLKGLYDSGTAVNVNAQGYNDFYTFDHWHINDKDDLSGPSIAIPLLIDTKATAIYKPIMLSFNKWVISFTSGGSASPTIRTPAGAGVEFKLCGPSDYLTESDSVVSAFTDINGKVNMALHGPGYYMLKEVVNPELSDIPDGLWLYVNENGMVYNGDDYSNDNGDAGQFNPNIYNLTLPTFGLTKLVGSGTPNSDSLSTTTGHTAHYQVGVTNPSNGLFSIKVTDKFEERVPAILADAAALSPGSSWTSTIYDELMSNVGTFDNTATLYITYPYNQDTARASSAVLSYDGFDGFRGFNINDYPVAIDSAKVIVTSTPSPTPVPTPVPTPPVANVSLALTIIGPGTANPGSGAYSLGSLVNFTITPDPAVAGAVFLGWTGADGAAVSPTNVLTMSQNRAVTANFGVPEPEVEIPAPLVPEGPVIFKPTPTPEAPIAPIVEETVPQAAPILPKTAGIPMGLLSGLGALLTASGVVIGRRKKGKE